MTTLVTEATGFLGSHVARKLVQRGEKVKILLRKTSRTSNIEDIDAERVYSDIPNGWLIPRHRWVYIYRPVIYSTL